MNSSHSVPSSCTERALSPNSPFASKSGDNRWVASPFLAHKHYTSKGEAYRWIMFGDDDTLFFLQVCE